jgi:hypothetical protein
LQEEIEKKTIALAISGSDAPQTEAHMEFH